MLASAFGVEAEDVRRPQVTKSNHKKLRLKDYCKKSVSV